MNQMILDYTSTFPDDVKERLIRMYETIKKLCHEAEERMTYSMPTFYLGENLLHFAAHKHHIGFYPGPEALVAFESEIQQYKNSKGAVQFPHSEPLPLKLIHDITMYRVKKAEEKLSKKKAKI